LSKHISTVPSTGKMPPPGARMGPRGRSASCGNGLSAQSVRLRSEINRIVNSLDNCSDLPSFIRYLFFVSTGNLVAHHFFMALDLFAQHFAQE
ncbi:MAG: hypothetical protein U0N99_03275, partial [Collinsella sp.]